MIVRCVLTTRFYECIISDAVCCVRAGIQLLYLAAAGVFAGPHLGDTLRDGRQACEQLLDQRRCLFMGRLLGSKEGVKLKWEHIVTPLRLKWEP
jgi:hypothetical protein